MSIPISILIFIAVLLVVIIAHELGHFFAAKAAGVKVLEFAIGFPPRTIQYQTGRDPVFAEPHPSRCLRQDCRGKRPHSSGQPGQQKPLGEDGGVLQRTFS